jgi:hypothetical protein
MRTIIKVLSLGIFFMLLIGISGTSYATEIFSYTFEDDLVGGLPSGWTPGDYGGNPVNAYVTDTIAGAGNKSFFMNDYVWIEQLSFDIPVGSFSGGVYKLQGMARAEQQNTDIGPFMLFHYGIGSCNTFRFGEDGTFVYYDGLNNRVSTGVSYNAEEWYSFDFIINLDIQRWSFSIKDSLGSSVVSATDLKFNAWMGYTIGFDTFQCWGTGYGECGQWYIDNVSLESIPEPATILLVGLGGIFLRRRFRR